MNQRNLTPTGTECRRRFNAEKTTAQHHHRSLARQELPDVGDTAKTQYAIRVDAGNGGQTGL